MAMAPGGVLTSSFRPHSAARLRQPSSSRRTRAATSVSARFITGRPFSIWLSSRMSLITAVSLWLSVWITFRNSSSDSRDMELRFCCSSSV